MTSRSRAYGNLPTRNADGKIPAGVVEGAGLSLYGSELRTARAAWANRASAPFNIVLVGDSVGSGYYATDYTGRWFQVMMNRIQIANGQIPDIGYVPCATDSTTNGYTGLNGTASGTTTQNIDLGLGYGNLTITSGTYTFPSFPCDRVWTIYPTLAGLGTMDISYDGGATFPDTANESGSTVGGRIKDSGALSNSVRGVVLQRHAATTVRAEGCYFFNGNGGTSGSNGAGVRGWNGSHFGFSTTQFAVTGASDWWTAGFDNVNPHLVIIALGINDQGGGLVSTNQYATNLNAIITQIDAVAATNSQTPPSIAVVVPYGTGTTAAASTGYQQAARAVVTNSTRTWGTAYVDWYELFGFVGTSAVDNVPVGVGVMSSSDGANAKKHLNLLGHKLAGEQMAITLVNAFGGVGSSLDAAINQSAINHLWNNQRSHYTLPTGAKAETLDRMSIIEANTTALTAGTLYMTAIVLQKDDVITSVSYTSGGTAITSGGTPHWWFGLFDSSYNAIRFTGDQTSTAWAASTTKTVNLSSTYTVPVTGLYFIGVCANVSTPPTILGVAKTNQNLANGIAPVLSFKADTGLTTPPALPFTATLSANYGQVHHGYVS